MMEKMAMLFSSIPNILFVIASAVALISAIFTVTRHNAVHALLYLVITMMAISLIFFLLGASFAAALQIIVYAGAIMVLFVFVTMMLHQGEATIIQEKQLYQPSKSLGASVLCIILLAECLFLLSPLTGEEPLAAFSQAAQTTQTETLLLTGKAATNKAVTDKAVTISGTLASSATVSGATVSGNIGAREIGLTLFGPYLLLVEISALLLLTALIGAFHLGRRHQEGEL